MPSSRNGHPAFEARSHPAEWSAGLSLDGGAKRRDADPEQRCGERNAVRNLMTFSIDQDLDESRHQCTLSGIARMGENAAAGIGGSRS